MDIRKFFSGAAATQSKAKETSCRPSAVDTSAKTAVKVVDTKPEKRTQQKSKTASKNSPSKLSNKTSTESNDICIIDSESESEDFSCKQSKKNLNNNDVKANKQSKVKSSENKESSSTADVSRQPCDSGAEKQQSCAGENKASDNVGKQSKRKKVKDDATGSSSKSVTVSQRKHVISDDDEDSESPLATRKGGRSSKRRVKDLSSSDEDLFGDDAHSSAKRKKKSKKPDIILSDTDSDEEPLPKCRRERSSKRKNRRLDADEDKPSIVDAISRMSSKPLSPKKSTTKPVEEVKQDISPADFFGLTPVRVGQESKIKSSKIAADTEVKSSKQTTKAEAPSADPDHSFDAAVDTMSTSAKLAAKMKAGGAEEQPTTPEKQKAAADSPSKIATVSASAQSEVSETSPSKDTTISTPSQHMKVESNDVESSQKKGSGYRNFLSREPPRALGTRDLPKGQDNCLEGLTFVVTGVLETVDRDDTKSLIERYGGKLTGNVSRNTSYVVVGRDAGESKLAKAKQLGTKQLDEDGLFKLIESLPAKKSKYELLAEKEAAKISETPSRIASPLSRKTANDRIQDSGATTTPQTQDSQATQLTQSPDVSAISDTAVESLLWVDKYKPTNLRQIIGQQGDRSNAKKLLTWLQNWHANLGRKPAFGRSNDDGAGHKAALLSGPPGIGKTTTAQIVCQTAGFSFIELNASDTRSKRSLHDDVAEAVNNHTLVDFFGSRQSSSAVDGRKHCLLMDEVDGMAGNEDRGGLQELIQLIKHSKIPVVCMCNDRNHPKIRSLSNYCFDLRFQRPRVEQIKGPILTIAYKEGLKIPPAALNDIISAANHDIRQVIHNMSMWTARDKSLTFDQLKTEAGKAQKDQHLGPFDVCRKVFTGGEETAHMTIADKSDLFFHDYSIGPLFVQENYIHVTPFAARADLQKHLRYLSRAAESIAVGDTIDAVVRRGQKWNMLPTQAIFASVLPGEIMRGSIGQMIQFPSWLGKNSTAAKNDRLLQELCRHMQLHISGSRQSVNMDYMPYLRHLMTSSLVSEGSSGIDQTVSLLHAYDLLREDFDNVLEVSSWSTTEDIMSHIDSKVKAAFTRSYNKTVHLTPYSTGAAPKKRGRQAAGGDEDAEDVYNEMEPAGVEKESEDSDDDVATDRMIVAKKAVKKAKDDRSSSKSSPAVGDKGAGKGKGQSKGSGQRKKKK